MKQNKSWHKTLHPHLRAHQEIKLFVGHRGECVVRGHEQEVESAGRCQAPVPRVQAVPLLQRRARTQQGALVKVEGEVSLLSVTTKKEKVKRTT